MQKYHWIAVLSSSITMFIWGFILALAPLTTEWPFVPKSDYTYLLVSAPAALLLGNMILGKLTDKYGRKSIFILDMILFSISIPLIIFSENVLELGLGIALAEFSLGGDENTILSYLSETIPKDLRGKVLVGVTNVANFGAAIAALLSILTGFSLFIQKLSYAILMIITIPIIVITRFSIPESFRWKEYKKLNEKAEIKEKDYAIRLYFLIAMAITIVLTYALMDLVIGPYLFPNYTSLIILIANIGETVAGISLIFFIDSINRKIFPFISYLGGVLTMILFIIQYFTIPGNFSIFLVILLLNAFFGEFGWAARVIFEPELLPTLLRGTGIGLVRGVAYSLYIASLFFTSSFNEFSYIIYNLAMWIIGFSGAFVWLLYGFDTKRKSLEEISDTYIKAKIKSIQKANN